ncbi:Serpentine Receptor, class E (Epsilon) [Caenorhabditis elegans]|uniref:Serpentine Receptor, class E (Epsilon) n=1 Tax=Caenorhabditis elegans TaxID=6239 RepID=G5EBZ3_CAEEL|nr:Serpentine Receptor, class E (Epsilon) [Caenorhabditis elegans]CAI46597.2 Serpentine Receptor, class E (Epsilon) [Caenorhabditis elegans]
MYISVNGSEARFIALFYVKAYQSQCPFEWLYTIFQILEILLVVVAGVLNMYTVYMALHTQSFHINITLIYTVFMFHWFELIISRFFLFPYQEAIFPLQIQNSNSLIVNTFDDIIVPISSPQTNLSLMLGAGLRGRWMLLVCFAIPCIAVERSFATLLVRDYEQKSRVYISISLIIFSELFATIAVYAVVFQIVGVLFLALTATILQLCSFGIIQAIKQKTKYFEKKCERNVNFYTLSVKFQLTENVQSFKLLHVLVIEVAIMITTVSITILLGDLGWISPDHTVFVFYVMEKFIHINPLFICSAVFYMKPRWLKSLLQLVPGRLARRTHAVEFSETEKIRESEADAHFEQLRKLW